MKSARKNHPWERIFIRRDEISGEESSLSVRRSFPYEQIANYLDFSSQSHFTAVFRKAVGTTPAIWQKEYKESNFEISIPDTEK